VASVAGNLLSLGRLTLLDGQNLSIYTSFIQNRPRRGTLFEWTDLGRPCIGVTARLCAFVLVVWLWSFGRPVSGIPSWVLTAVDGSTPFRLPGGGIPDGALPLRARVLRTTFCCRQKGTKERPIPSYPCGAIGRSPAGGIPPPATPTGPPPSGGGWRGTPHLIPGPQAIARRARFSPQRKSPNTAN